MCCGSNARGGHGGYLRVEWAVGSTSADAEGECDECSSPEGVVMRLLSKKYTQRFDRNETWRGSCMPKSGCSRGGELAIAGKYINSSL